MLSDIVSVGHPGEANGVREPLVVGTDTHTYSWLFEPPALIVCQCIDVRLILVAQTTIKMYVNMLCQKKPTTLYRWLETFGRGTVSAAHI